MRINNIGLQLIKAFEGLRLEAYQDQGGKWSIGYGHTTDVNPSDTCTEYSASFWLQQDLDRVENVLTAYLPNVPLTNNQWSALVSFCFNVGWGKQGIKSGFKELKEGGTSTLRTKLLARDYAGAALEIPKWNKINGVPCVGIARRRLSEQELFNTPDLPPVA